LILGFLGAYQRARKEGERPFEAALIICGREGKYQLCPEVRDIMEGVDGAPMMLVGLSTHQAMTKINNFTPKLNFNDTNRVSVAVNHYEPYIDFDELLRRTTSDNSSFNDPSTFPFEDLKTR
jgi:hypothetical protein